MSMDTEKIFKDMMEFPAYSIDFKDFEEFWGRINNVSLKNRPYVSYGDVLFLLYYLPDSRAYEFYDRGEREEIRNGLLCELFMALKSSMSRSDVINRFMSLTIDEFLGYISGSGERSEERLRTDIELYREKTLCCSEYKLKADSTLSDLADEITRIRADKSGEEYKKAVYICSEDLYYFLIKYVRKKFYSVFDISCQHG